MLVNVMTLVGMIGVMFYLNWRFTLIALSVAPVLFLVVYSLHAAHQEAPRAPCASRKASCSPIVEEVLTSIRVVKAFAREDYEQQRFDSESLANVEAGLQARSIKAKLAPVVEVIVADRHVSGALVRRAAGAGRAAQRRRADRLPAVSGQDVQADARSVEDDRHRLEGDGRLRAHSGSAGDRKPRARRAGRAPGARSSRARSNSTTSASATATTSTILKDVSFTIEAGTGRGDCRSVGHGQDDDRQPDSAVLRSGVRDRSPSMARTSASTG